MTSGTLPLLDHAAVAVAAQPSRKEAARQRVRDWYAANPLKLEGLPPAREPGERGAPPVLPGPGRSVYTKLTPEGARSRLAMALRVGPKRLPLLHRAAELHRDHGDWARAELHRRRADGTARTWGVDVEGLDAVLERAGVPPAGEYLATIPGAEP